MKTGSIWIFADMTIATACRRTNGCSVRLNVNITVTFTQIELNSPNEWWWWSRRKDNTTFCMSTGVCVYELMRIRSGVIALQIEMQIFRCRQLLHYFFFPSCCCLFFCECKIRWLSVVMWWRRVCVTIVVVVFWLDNNRICIKKNIYL